MNNVMIIGRLTRDPELAYLQSGTPYAKFNVAVDRELSKEKKEEMANKGRPTADFPNIVVWGKQGESCAKYLAKGRLVAIQGRIQTGSYTAQDGSKRYTTDVVAERVKFLEWGNNGTQQSGDNSSDNNDYSVDGFVPVDDDDVPW